MYERVISFDCANRTLAYTCAVVDTLYFKKLGDLSQRLNSIVNSEWTEDIVCEIAKIIVELEMLCLGAIKVLHWGVIDVIGANISTCDAVQRSQMLCNVLNTLPVEWSGATVVIEDQPDIMQSNIIQAQITMYVQAVHHCNVKLVDPASKNKIDFDPTISMSVFLQHCNSRYQANKAHATANFLHFINTFGLGRMLNTIVGSKYDDLADSFLQLLVYAQSIYR